MTCLAGRSEWNVLLCMEPGIAQRIAKKTTRCALADLVTHG